MINKITSGIAACALAFTPVAFASSSIKMGDAYLGVEAIQTNQKYKAGFGDKVFKKNPMDFSVFGGFKFHKHFGVEVGFEGQPNKKKNFSFRAGEFVSGVAATVPITGEASIKATHPYVGLFGEHKCHFGFGKMKFQGLIGASVSRVRARQANLTGNNIVLTEAEYNQTVRTYSKTKVVPMVKVSATYMVTDCVGVRLSGNYRNMSAFKIKATPPAGVTTAQQIKLKDSFGVGLGVTYSFN